MTGSLRLRLWGPSGEYSEYDLDDSGDVTQTLVKWAEEIGCGPNDIDYQVNDGLRIMGEANPYAGEVD